MLYMDWKDERYEFKSHLERQCDCNKSNGDFLKAKNPEDKVFYVEQPIIEKIWTPNIFLMNAIEYKALTLEKPVESLRIYPDGSIKRSKTLRLMYLKQTDAQKLLVISTKATIRCLMDFRNFPFDYQFCTFDFHLVDYHKRKRPPQIYLESR